MDGTCEEEEIKLVEECHKQGWRAHCMPTEVGGKGFAEKSLSCTVSVQGMTSVVDHMG